MATSRRKGRAVRQAPRRRSYNNVPIEYVSGYAATLLRQINQQLGHVVSFTREDLLRMEVAAFAQVATITRYRATCLAVRYLIEHRALVPMKSPDLCLPRNAPSYHFDKTSVASEYHATVRSLVTTMPRRRFTVMHVVQRWTTDPQLTTDTKRKAVRVVLPLLVRNGLCRRVGAFEYIVGAST